MTRTDFDQAILNSIASAIVVLDRNGIIIAVNSAWRRLAQRNGIDPSQTDRQAGIGIDYLAVCDPGAPEIGAHIASVLAGTSPEFSLEYGCEGTAGQRWFNMHVTPLGPDREGVVITHTDITERVSSEVAMRDYAHQVQALSRRVQRLQEMERRSVVQQLHEGLAQALTILKLNLQASADSLAAPTHMADNLVIVEDSLLQIRRLALTLRPTMLDDLGLAAALEWLSTEAAAWSGFTVRYDCDLPDMRYAPEVETACFRIAQEALNNVSSHAGAQRVRVSLQLEGGRLQLCVEDDGCGFDVDDRPDVAGRNLGLLDMRERAAIVGGRLSLESARGQGCTVRLCCPGAPACNREPTQH
jgi:signal transduction histidine kinase